MAEPATPSTNGPFFLVGSERSGTTLLRLMLSNHPEIECAPEFEFLVEAVPEDSGWPALEAYYEWLSTNRIFLPHDLEIDRTLDYPALARSFLEQYCARTEKPVRGATCHKNFDRLERIWPDVRFVHLLRDGRDVARSCVGMGWAGNVWSGAERWIEAETLWDRVAAGTPPEKRFELCYEDLISEPERELGRLCAFLGREYHPDMLRYDEESSYSRPDPSLVYQWRRKLSPEELSLLETRIGPLLRARGYEDSGVEPARMGLVRRIGLDLQDRMGRMRFRRKRYGLRLMLESRVARLLGMKELERRVVLARNEIDNRHLH